MPALWVKVILGEGLLQMEELRTRGEYVGNLKESANKSLHTVQYSRSYCMSIAIG